MKREISASKIEPTGQFKSPRSDAIRCRNSEWNRLAIKLILQQIFHRWETPRKFPIQITLLCWRQKKRRIDEKDAAVLFFLQLGHNMIIRTELQRICHKDFSDKIINKKIQYKSPALAEEERKN